MNQPKKLYSIIFYSIFSAFVFGYLLYLFIIPHDDKLFDTKDSFYFNDNWTQTFSDQTVKILNFPCEIEENIPNGFELTNTIPTNLGPHVDSFAKFGVFQDVTIMIDGTVIYQSKSDYSSDRYYSKYPAPAWSIFYLPKDCAGKTITVRMTSDNPNYTTTVGSFRLGSRSSLIFQILQGKFFKLGLSFVFVLTGILFILLSLAFIKKLNMIHSFSYMGWFFFWTGCWIFSETHTYQIFTGNAPFIIALSFISLSMMLVSFTKYYISLNIKHFTRYFKGILCVLYTYCIVNILLRIFHICDFLDTMYVLHSLAVVLIISLIFCISCEVFYYKNKSMWYMMFCIVILGLSGALELLSYYFRLHQDTGDFLYIGLLISIFFLGLQEFKRSLRIIEQTHEARYYKKLATTDFMTGCKNRTAYSEFIDKKNDNLSEKPYFSVVLGDLNQLKMINDMYGHDMGDKAIITCGNILKNNFSDVSSCYRIGGDEFVCVMNFPIEESLIQKKIETVKKDIMNANPDFPFHLSMAIGYAIYDSNKDKNVDDTVKRADREMYLIKNHMRNGS